MADYNTRCAGFDCWAMGKNLLKGGVIVEFYGGCMFCDKAVECAMAGKPAADCHVEALNKAWHTFKEELKRDPIIGKIYEVLVSMCDALARVFERR